MQNSPLDDIKQIVDLLGPDMWLELNHVSFQRYFNINIDTGRDVTLAVEAGGNFSEQCGCVFIFDELNRTARFGRAYYKKAIPS